jgi:hypothetical protein
MIYNYIEGRFHYIKYHVHVNIYIIMWSLAKITLKEIQKTVEVCHAKTEGSSYYF